jgi:ribosomal protein L13E
MFKKEVIHKDLQRPYQPQKGKRRSPKKIRFEKDKEVVGIREDGIFKIVYNPEKVKYDDNRKNKSGKVCSSYPKEILKKMIDTLGIKVDDKTKITKEMMCDALEKYLIK